jgi:hypothetical protein
MENIKKQIDFKNLKDHEKYMACLLFSKQHKIKNLMKNKLSYLIRVENSEDSDSNSEYSDYENDNDKEHDNKLSNDNHYEKNAKRFENKTQKDNINSTIRNSPIKNRNKKTEEEKEQKEEYEKIANENQKSINANTKRHVRRMNRKVVADAIRQNKIYPYPIFKIKDLPNHCNPFPWFENMERNSLSIPTFIGKFKELIWDNKPQMILEDSEGNEIKIVLTMDEEFDSLQEWMLNLKYEIGKYVFVYDAFKINLGEKECCIVIDSFQNMTNENWICRLKPRSGISAKYIPKIIFAFFMLWICYIYDLK